MAGNLQDMMGANFSISTTAYTLAVSTKVPDASGALNDLFVILGRVQSFNPSQNKALEKIFEINTASGGEAVEIVPGGIPTDEISLDRIDIYPVPFLNAFGGLEANNLRSQNHPFTITEIIFDPKDIKRTMMIEYINCYLTDFSDPIDISDGGSGPITVSGSVQVAFRRARPLFTDLGGTVNFNNDNQKATIWASFKEFPGTVGSQGGYREHQLNDKGLNPGSNVILSRDGLATLANVCV